MASNVFDFGENSSSFCPAAVPSPDISIGFSTPGMCHAAPLSSSFISGVRSANSFGSRPSNRRGGSMMWSSVEMTLYSRGMACPPRVSGWQSDQSYADVTQPSDSWCSPLLRCKKAPAALVDDVVPAGDHGFQFRPRTYEHWLWIRS